MKQQTRSCVRLVTMVFYAHHGVLKEEHRVGARYEVDAELAFDFTCAAQSDDISKTVDYGAVYQKIQGIMTGGQYSLLETITSKIACELIRDFLLIEEITVKVRKCNPPLDGICDYAEAEYSMSRR